MDLLEFKKIAKIVLGSINDLSEGVITQDDIVDKMSLDDEPETNIYSPKFNSSILTRIDKPKSSFDVDIKDFSEKNKFKPAVMYDLWKSDPSETNFSNVINSLKPTMQYALASNGVAGDPLLTTNAKVLTAKAIKNFDPEFGVALPTYVTSQLQKLTRIAREARQPVKISERKTYEVAELAKAEEEFRDKYDKDPTVEELADFSDLSIDKIKDLRKYFKKQISENNFFANKSSSDETPSSVDESKGEFSNFSDEALGYVYKDLGNRDKKILEYLSGYGGSDILPPKLIAKKLNISQSQISRIMVKLAGKIFDINQALTKVYG